MNAITIFGVDSNGRPVKILVQDDALQVHPSRLAGERNPDSLTNSYIVVKDCDWNLSVVDLSADSTVVTPSPAYLGGVYVNTGLSAHACPIQDDTAARFTLPASLAAGTFVPISGRFETNITVDPDNAATGSITVLWRPM